MQQYQTPPRRGKCPLNPRRALHAAWLVAYLNQFGRKLFLPTYYGHIESMCDLDPVRADQALDDLYDLGLTEMHVTGSGHVVVELLSDDLEGALSAPAPDPALMPRPQRRPERRCRRPIQERGRA